MTTATYDHSGFTRVVICFGLIAFTAGCTGLSQIKPSQATISPESSVVAFSVNTSRLLEYDMPMRAARLHLISNEVWDKIRLSEGETGLQRFLIGVPTQSIILYQFDLAVIHSFSYLYGTKGVGPRIQLTPGKITYLGRLEIEDIQLEENDDRTRGWPIAVNVVFSDALEDDLSAWKQEYKLFQNRLPVKRIVGNWGELEYIPVFYINPRRLEGFGISPPDIDIVLPSF